MATKVTTKLKCVPCKLFYKDDGNISHCENCGEELKQIKETSLSIEGVLGVHQLRTRRSGPIRFIQLHLELEDNIPLIEAHRISDEVEDKLISVFPDADVLIHQDPYSVVFGPEKQQKFHSW